MGEKAFARPIFPSDYNEVEQSVDREIENWIEDHPHIEVDNIEDERTSIGYIRPCIIMTIEDKL